MEFILFPRSSVRDNYKHSYKNIGCSMNTFSNYPLRGERNSRGIYVLVDGMSSNIGFYNLSSVGTLPVIKSQSSFESACGFMDEETVICTTYSTGDIYKYDLTKNYKQIKISENNPSGDGFHTILVTGEKQIIAAYKGCIYIYTKSGTYIGNSCSLEANSYMFQMKEIRRNIIVTAQVEYVHSHNINNPSNNIIHKLLDYAETQTKYLTLELLESNTGGYIALGGYHNSSGTIYGYLELFHLGQHNYTLNSISNKRWDGLNNGCAIYIIREIHIGVIIFAGSIECEEICIWEYALSPHKDPTCFLLNTSIRDVISLP